MKRPPDDAKARISIGDGLMAAQVLLAVVGALFVYSMTFTVAGCVNRCNYPAVDRATRGFWAVDLAVLLICAAAYLLLRSRIRASGWIPLAGVVITLGALAVTIVILNGALVLG
ncbi:MULTISPECIES: hypothetical protein [unclassified Microbacterium]|uniref:hypothetical protein n=1 Tax=unclassified Microbacterium TaxID=2609290 RepID=UPI001604D43D|nr:MULTISPECIES: hypothetical protein [unclassified Microbacterium]QNA93982.1 hypothetical protein G4G29_20060 [Microbacterium sp. Se63.02b]QYM64309.1 hypothetical protein K1X59_20105 [Microbacterium sp. Se5.02b]